MEEGLVNSARLETASMGNNSRWALRRITHRGLGYATIVAKQSPCNVFAPNGDLRGVAVLVGFARFVTR